MAGGMTTKKNMNNALTALEPIKAPSLKEACVSRLEALILSGELKIGERLPPERELAKRLGVSRPILHEALVEMATKGLVAIIPRKGILINDYRRTGSTAFLSTLLNYQDGKMSADFQRSMMETRILLETETARLAAIMRTGTELLELKKIVLEEHQLGQDGVARRTELDFDFHLQIALMSRNMVYPLIINSLKSFYTGLTGQFFSHFAGSPILGEVLDFHEQLILAVEVKEENEASEIMRRMLVHGQDHLMKGA